MPNYLKFIVTLVLFGLVTASSANSASTSKGLLGEALKLSNSINSNLTVEQRLERYQKIQKVVDQILSDHAGTDEGISLLSGQKIGNFNYAGIQEKYIGELTKYYDTVCVVSPSFKCIAFVSLDQGIKSCRSASDFKTLDAAHRNIMNSLNVFSSQGAKKSYQSLALNAYRNCISVANVKTTRAIKDYFSSRLIPAFLSLGKKNQVKAIIQKMKDPYLKFVAVIEMRQSSGKGFTRQYIDRLSKYVKAKMSPKDKPMKDKLRWFRSQKLAALRLKYELLKQNKFKVTAQDHQGKMGVLGDDRDVRLQIMRLGWEFPNKRKLLRNTCNANFSKLYFETLVDLIDVSVSRASGKIGRSINDTLASFLAITTTPFDLYGCASKIGGRSYGTALKAYIFIRAYNSAEASKFLAAAAAVNYDSKNILKYLFDLESSNPALRNVRIKLGSVVSIRDDFYKFKDLVRAGKMCNAVKTIFKKFKGKDIYNKAIGYLIESPDVDRNKKYDCGDAELEMLLK